MHFLVLFAISDSQEYYFMLIVCEVNKSEFHALVSCSFKRINCSQLQ